MIQVGHILFQFSEISAEHFIAPFFMKEKSIEQHHLHYFIHRKGNCQDAGFFQEKIGHILT